jgi:hypothetical protein
MRYARPGGAGEVNLSVDFQIHNNGPPHVSGLVVTTDFWITSKIVPAVFQRFGQGFEFWHVDVSASGPPVKFEFVIF